MEDAQRRARSADDGRSVRHALYDLDLSSSDCILAFLELWDWAGCRPGKLTISPAFIAGLVRRIDPRSARNWIEAWAAAGLVTILDRDRRRGAYLIWLEDPREVPALKRHREEPDLFDAEDGATHDGTGGASGTRAETCAHRFPPDVHQFPRQADSGGNVRASVSAPRPPAAGAARALSETQVAEYRSVVAEARAAIARPARGLLRAKGKEGNTSLEGSGKRQRLKSSIGEDPPTPETAAPLAFDAAIAAMPPAADTATQRARVAAELAEALRVGDALRPGFWANVAALVGEPGPDGRVQFTRAVVDAILARAWAKQPHAAVLRAQYASKAIRSQARHCGLEWPRAP